MRATFYAGGLPHFAMHLAPIYRALDPRYRGGFHAIGRSQAAAEAMGIRVTDTVPRETLTVVASYEDLHATRRSHHVLVNHGIGQTYPGDPDTAAHPSFAGGRGRDRVNLFIEPSARVAAIDQAAYPDARTVVAGTPYLDGLTGIERPTTKPPVVVVSFHADASGVCPEARWAHPHYAKALERIAASLQGGRPPFTLLGHAHPRMRHPLERFWRSCGVRFVESWAEARAKADLYVADTSSTQYEAAACGIPVLALNAPWYRRDVEHGLRFWSHVPGLQCDEPDDLFEMILAALADSPTARMLRENAVAYAYDGTLDGQASRRAADAIARLVEDTWT